MVKDVLASFSEHRHPVVFPSFGDYPKDLLAFVVVGAQGGVNDPAIERQASVFNGDGLDREASQSPQRSGASFSPVAEPSGPLPGRSGSTAESYAPATTVGLSKPVPRRSTGRTRTDGPVPE